MRIAANLSMLFTELPLIDRIDAAASAGFDGVEIQFPYEVPARTLNAELARCNMPLVLINLPAGDFINGGAGLSAIPSKQIEFNSALEQALKYAEVARPRYVNVLAGRIGHGLCRETATDQLAVNVRKAAEIFEPLGIQVLVEMINTLDVPGYLIDTPMGLDDLLKRVDHPNCGAQLDIYHLARQGFDVDSEIRTLKRYIKHVQFADCPGRGEPGSGELDLFSAVRALREIGYDDWMSAEYKPVNMHKSLQWLSTWREWPQVRGCNNG
ncbi:TIM barrel protein [Pseudomonas sp. PDM15]|uniref:hydroxypyruvate isomerase family protein n=1 Tax=Pseudomonas sp. PDM15 TaxID=2769303 RepID=UPI001780564B|nr:TIM barrel protein [Pseudomonas sp. PDM15]MBD9424680.1 TIM barrel protein [Pseudomonas sp. PDM15]